MNVEPIVAVYGPAASSGLGSAVFTAQGVAAETLEAAALARYREFVGGSWDRRASAWQSGFAELYRRGGSETRGIVAELRALQPAEARGVVDVMLDGMEDPAAASAALGEVFDQDGIRELRLYALGDGEAMAGVAVAALHASGESVFLVMLLD